MFKIEFTPEANDDVHLFKKYERRQIIAGIESQLGYQPMQETRNRKKLRPNELAEWELRIGKFRIFYDVDEETKSVKVEAIGYKEGNRLFVHGEEYQL